MPIRKIRKVLGISLNLILTGLRQSRSKCNIFGQARRPAPTRVCRGDSLWSPGSMKFDFDASLLNLTIPLTYVQK